MSPSSPIKQNIGKCCLTEDKARYSEARVAGCKKQCEKIQTINKARFIVAGVNKTREWGQTEGLSS